RAGLSRYLPSLFVASLYASILMYGWLRAESRLSEGRSMGKKAEIKGFYYITHIENLLSILQHGILSHAQIEARKVPFRAIYDADIVSNRKGKSTPDRSSLWEYANLYLQARNPMMYRVVHEKGAKDLAVVGVKPDVLSADGIWLTDGNAANAPTQFYHVPEGL